MFGWLKRILGGPADQPVKTDERKIAPVEIGAPNFGGSEAGVLSFEDSKSTERKIASSTVSLPQSAPRPDLAALQAKFSKGPKKKRRHDKHRHGRLPKFPNGINPGGRH